MPVSMAATSCLRARARPSLFGSMPTSAIILRFLLRKILNIRSEPMLPEPMTATLSGMCVVASIERECLDETDRDGAENTEMRRGDVTANDRKHAALRAGHDQVSRFKFQPVGGQR